MYENLEQLQGSRTSGRNDRQHLFKARKIAASVGGGIQRKPTACKAGDSGEVLRRAIGAVSGGNEILYGGRRKIKRRDGNRYDDGARDDK